MEKTELIENVLDRYGIRFVPTQSRWQSVRCPNTLAHAHQDANPSARLNLTFGLIRCMACELNGDAYNVLMVVEGIDFKQAVKELGSPTVEQESDWLI